MLSNKTWKTWVENGKFVEKMRWTILNSSNLCFHQSEQYAMSKELIRLLSMDREIFQSFFFSKEAMSRILIKVEGVKPRPIAIDRTHVDKLDKSIVILRRLKLKFRRLIGRRTMKKNSGEELESKKEWTYLCMKAMSAILLVYSSVYKLSHLSPVFDYKVHSRSLLGLVFCIVSFKLLFDFNFTEYSVSILSYAQKTYEP